MIWFNNAFVVGYMLGERPVVVPDTIIEADVRRVFGNDLAKSVWPEFAAKRLDKARAEALNAKLEAEWEKIGARLSAVLLPAATIKSVLATAGGPLTPEAIHLDRGFYQQALKHGREIRNRYTILDLAAQSGRLETMLSSL